MHILREPLHGPSDQVFSRSASVWSAESGAVGSCFPLCLYQKLSGSALRALPQLDILQQSLRTQIFETILFSKVLQPYLMNWACGCFEIHPTYALIQIIL